MTRLAESRGTGGVLSELDFPALAGMLASEEVETRRQVYLAPDVARFRYRRIKPALMGVCT